MTGQHHAGDAGTLGAAQQRAQVARVGDAGRDEQERRRAAATRPAQVLEGDRLERAGQRDDPLGRLGAGLGVEAGPRHRLDRDPQAGGQLLDPVELRRGVLVLGQQDPAHRAPPHASAARARPGAPRPGRHRARSAPRGGLVPAIRPARGGPRRRAALAARPGPGAARRSRRAAAPWRRARRPPAHACSIRTTAMHAMPSARPSAPIPSARVALTDTGAPSTGRAARPWPRCAGRAGACPPRRAVGVDAGEALLRRPCGPPRPRGRCCRRPPRPGPCRGSAGPGRRGRRRRGRRRPARGHTASASLWPPSPRAPSITTPPSTSRRCGSSEKRWMSMPWPMRTLSGLPRRQQALGRTQVVGRRDLEVAGVARHDHDRAAQRLDQHGVVGGAGAPPLRRGPGAARRPGRPAASAPPPGRRGRAWWSLVRPRPPP